MATMQSEDSLDIDRYLNLDGGYSPAPALVRGKSIATPEFKPPIINTNTFAPLQQNSQTFAGPSHQYDLHKQHIPLPPGALANSLAAAQRPTFAYNGFQQEFGMGSNTGLYDVSSTEEIFDFNAMQGHNPSFSSSNDMDMDFDSPVEGAFSNGSDIVDPNAVGGHEDDSPTPTRAEIVRAYPGMHVHKAQQAALAKQQQQLEIQRQQQQRAAQRSQQVSSHKPSLSRSSGNRPPMDPAVEERISRLLNQMRQSSVGSDDAETPKQSSAQSLSKAKKDEEDMDEDERLLASEEGKKLSSKERRQLRNKVSARAFRSRRKEYISQLEGEVAVKCTEADTLKAENEALKAENSRLTDLTKLLLSSSAFSTFLNDLSTNGLPPSIGQGLNQQPTIQSQSPPQTTISQPQQPQQYQMQQPNNAHAGMMTIPESQMAFGDVEAMNNNWNVGVDFNFTPQIFTLTEAPHVIAPESLDIGLLSGKSALPSTSEHFSEKKETIPALEAPPRCEKEVIVTSPSSTTEIELDESNPAFSLFIDAPQALKPSEPVYQIFGPIELEKAVERFEIVVVEDEPSSDGVTVSDSTLARFERISASLDSISEGLDQLTIRW